jgi:hypothetical protein
MFVRETKSDEKIKAEPLELNPAPGHIEAGNLKQISKHNSYTVYNIAYFVNNVKWFFLFPIDKFYRRFYISRGL